jgi:hypothetical protein
MSHHDSHHHHGSRPTGTEMDFTTKARKLIAHWIHHNDEHAKNYRQWVGEFQKNDLPSAAVLLQSAADLTSQINLTLQQALEQMDHPSDS